MRSQPLVTPFGIHQFQGREDFGAVLFLGFDGTDPWSRILWRLFVRVHLDEQVESVFEQNPLGRNRMLPLLLASMNP